MLQQLARDRFGAQNVNVDSPTFLDRGVTVSGVWLSYPRLFIIGVVVLAVIVIVIAIAARHRSTSTGARLTVGVAPAEACAEVLRLQQCEQPDIDSDLLALGALGCGGSSGSLTALSASASVVELRVSTRFSTARATR